jgi:ferredoxin
MKGTSEIRAQGTEDPLLVKMLREHGLSEVPLWSHRPPEENARRARWAELAKFRDGTVNPERTSFASPEEGFAEITRFARALGASDVGIARLTPVMIRDGLDLTHDTVICMIVAENYAAALNGPRAIESEAATVYVRCAEIATAMASHIRDLGYPAIAHHNGACDIQAIPAMIAAGLGELGKHGSLVHPEFGASHRPAIVTTTMALPCDAPFVFGVQETCMHCNLCSNNCPGDAIPRDEFVLTEGVRRWVTDVEKCYVYSRLRPEYCHICVDVCPYVHMANDDPVKRALYKRYTAERKKLGYKTPTRFADSEGGHD